MRLKMICAVACIVLSLLMAAPALALEKPKDQLDKEMNLMEAFIQNALVKVKNNTVGMGAASRGPAAVQRDARMSPSGQCCEANILAIADASGRWREILQGLRDRFRENEKRSGVASVRAMLFHVDDIEGRVRQFAGTGEREFAVQFLELALAAMTNLREEKLDLEACCADLLPKLAEEPAEQTQD